MPIMKTYYKSIMTIYEKPGEFLTLSLVVAMIKALCPIHTMYMGNR